MPTRAEDLTSSIGVLVASAVKGEVERGIEGLPSADRTEVIQGCLVGLYLAWLAEKSEQQWQRGAEAGCTMFGGSMSASSLVPRAQMNSPAYYACTDSHVPHVG